MWSWALSLVSLMWTWTFLDGPHFHVECIGGYLLSKEVRGQFPKKEMILLITH